MFICHDLVRRIVALADEQSATEWPLAMLFLATYVFLLRLPSEALPMTVVNVGCAQGKQSVISLEGEEVCLRLGRETICQVRVSLSLGGHAGARVVRPLARCMPFGITSVD